MKKSLLFIPLLLIILLCQLPLAAIAQEPAGPPLTVAVLPFESTDPALKAKAEEAAILLGAQLSADVNLWMVERAELDKILSEQNLQLSGLTDPAEAVQLGKLIGARVLITGRLIRSGKTGILVAKVMSTETSRVFGETAPLPAPETIDKPTADLAGKVSTLIQKQQAAFRAKTIPRAERMAALRQLLTGKQLPTVEVSIQEQDLSQNPIDPAVETEIKKVLSELGFPIVDPATAKLPAEIFIKGEAFSQAGARHGQLISARARAEVQAIQRSTGKILAIDRETTTAIDNAPATAGKTALQEAGFAIAERLVPKLLPP